MSQRTGDIGAKGTFGDLLCSSGSSLRVSPARGRQKSPRGVRIRPTLVEPSPTPEPTFPGVPVVATANLRALQRSEEKALHGPAHECGRSTVHSGDSPKKPRFFGVAGRRIPAAADLVHSLLGRVRVCWSFAKSLWLDADCRRTIRAVGRLPAEVVVDKVFTISLVPYELHEGE